LGSLHKLPRDGLWMGVPVLTLVGNRHAAGLNTRRLTPLGSPRAAAAPITKGPPSVARPWVGGPISLFSKMTMAARPHLVKHHVAKFVKKGRKQMERERRRAARKAEKKRRMAERRAAQAAGQPVSPNAESSERSADQPQARHTTGSNGC
jgi:hypothetical protein